MRSLEVAILLTFVSVAVAEPDPLCPYPSHAVTFFPNPDDPTKFFECYEGNKFELSCPLKLFWNQKLQVCDFVKSVKHDLKRDPLCPYPSHDIVFFPDPDDETKYFECYEGNKYVMSCPANFSWNQGLKTCYYLSKEGLGLQRDPICPYPTHDIVFFPDPDDPTKYFVCNEGDKYVMSCPENLYWIQRMKACVYLPKEGLCVTQEDGTSDCTKPNFTSA